MKKALLIGLNALAVWNLLVWSYVFAPAKPSADRPQPVRVPALTGRIECPAAPAVFPDEPVKVPAPPLEGEIKPSKTDLDQLERALAPLLP